MRESETEMIAGPGEARIHDMADTLLFGGIDNRAMSRDHDIVFRITGGNHEKSLNPGKIKRARVIEVDFPFAWVVTDVAVAAKNKSLTSCRNSACD